MRLLIGYLIAGKPALDLLGSLYGSIAGSAINVDHLLITLQLVKYSLIGHILGLSVLFGLPLAIMADCSCQEDDEKVREPTPVTNVLHIVYLRRI